MNAAPTSRMNLITALGGDERVSSFALMPDGRIVVAGTNRMEVSPYNTNALVLRYLANGRPDTSLNTGNALAGIKAFDVLERTSCLTALQADGKVLALFNHFNNPAILTRLNVDGTTDTTFGSNGSITLAVTSSNDFHSHPIACRNEGRAGGLSRQCG
ncbi:MAG: hypothetical protein IPK32_17535 [Verrucomicrobiaceae bacterium]|nr:hypothetical protein [Verrucomicrobiaceae bacterium]